MLSQKLNRSLSLLAAALVAGTVGNQAAAIEEVVVYGTDTSTTKADATALRSQMREYVDTLHDQQKTILNAEFASKSAGKLQLAAAGAPTRG